MGLLHLRGIEKQEELTELMVRDVWNPGIIPSAQKDTIQKFVRKIVISYMLYSLDFTFPSFSL